MPRRWRALSAGVMLAALLLGPVAQAREAIVRHPAPDRLVALGDWHGDLGAARLGLRLAGAIDSTDRWCGGGLVVVQTGDRLDRGGDEQAILDLLHRLAEEASAAGGAVYTLLGNHEVMNVAGDFRYVTDRGWEDFADAGVAVARSDTSLHRLPEAQRPRAAALRPGGPYARVLSGCEVALIVGRTVFVHGGLLPEHLAYGIERLNAEARAWLLGAAPPPALLERRDAPTWVRHYSDEPDAEDCALLERVLADLGCDRMVVGHTVQEGGITPRCDQRVWCIDTGASSHYGGPVQVLQIAGEEVTVLR